MDNIVKTTLIYNVLKFRIDFEEFFYKKSMLYSI